MAAFTQMFQSPLNIFIDKDGVLAEYNKEDYIGSSPAYLQPGYFRNRMPIQRTIDSLAYLLLTRGPLNVNVTINILTAVSENPTQIDDNVAWCVEHIPWCRFTNFAEPPIKLLQADTPREPKWMTAQNFLGESLTPKDILIDDYNGNLNAWVERGGTGVKFLNGINTSGTFKGFEIEEGASALEIATKIALIMDNIAL